MADEMFGDAIDYSRVRVHHAKWFPFQPRNVAMAPDGDLWFHPEGELWRDDFSTASINLQALFIHELTHVWQVQSGIWLWLRRYPLSRYAYRLKAGKPLLRFGVEQQATIIEHAFVARRRGQPDRKLDALLRDAGLDYTGAAYR